LDRVWLLTWTTYATWLPGDPRGFVSNIEDGIRHNVLGTDYDSDMPTLQQYMSQKLRGAPIYLIKEQAQVLLKQFQETTTTRGWTLIGTAIMMNHIHILVGVPGDPEPEDLLRDFKNYGSRALNRRWGKPESDTWWTVSGSKRKSVGSSRYSMLWNI
jgi:REP element-mobilizing transposase RayT